MGYAMELAIANAGTVRPNLEAYKTTNDGAMLPVFTSIAMGGMRFIRRGTRLPNAFVLNAVAVNNDQRALGSLRTALMRAVSSSAATPIRRKKQDQMLVRGDRAHPCCCRVGEQSAKAKIYLLSRSILRKGRPQSQFNTC
jgi:hypothetical protein